MCLSRIRYIKISTANGLLNQRRTVHLLVVFAPYMSVRKSVGTRKKKYIKNVSLKKRLHKEPTQKQINNAKILNFEVQGKSIILLPKFFNVHFKVVRT